MPTTKKSTLTMMLSTIMLLMIMTLTPISIVHSLPINAVDSSTTKSIHNDDNNGSSHTIETITESSIPLHRSVRQTTIKRDENQVIINENNDNDVADNVRPYLHFENMLPEQIVIEQDEQQHYMLECDVLGTPNPKIYWLRNGKLINQQKNIMDFNENNDNDVSSSSTLSMLLLKSSIRPSSTGQLGLSRVKSRLYLDCLNPVKDSGAIYTCVAVTSFEQKRTNTKLIIVPRRSSSSSSNSRNDNDKEMELFDNSLIENSLIPGASLSSSTSTGNYHKIINNQSPNSGNDLSSTVSCLEKKSLNSPAKIYFWTQTLMENMGNNVIIHCRAMGFPKPRINWFVNGQLTPIDESSMNGKYQVLPNGDLIIHNTTFDDMGVYQCTASNEFGTDSIDEIFFYPTMKE
uniref:Neuroglian-like n=1 Tax=Dermatophagoides pteronyssinus TaxID=6956 RepID=A0A6P6XYY8_DERPT|nr:neuroglian-like [Dermatophagoides pteronyssinus]